MFKQFFGLLLCLLVVTSSNGAQQHDLKTQLANYLIEVASNTKDKAGSYLKFKMALLEASNEDVVLPAKSVNEVVTAICRNQGNRYGERMLVALSDHQKEVCYDKVTMEDSSIEGALAFAALRADRKMQRGIPLMRGIINAGASSKIKEHLITNRGKSVHMPLIDYWRNEALDDFVSAGYAEEDFEGVLDQIAEREIGAYEAPSSLYVYDELTYGIAWAPPSVLGNELKQETAKEPLIKMHKTVNVHTIKCGPKRYKKQRLDDSYELQVSERPTVTSLLRKEAKAGRHVCVCDYCGVPFK